MDKASPPLDLAALDIFRTVAAEGSVTRAAERLQRVQSNVTTRVRQLEADLGTPLFLREGKRMALTPAGATAPPVARGGAGAVDRPHARTAGAAARPCARRRAGGLAARAVARPCAGSQPRVRRGTDPGAAHGASARVRPAGCGARHAGGVRAWLHLPGGGAGLVRNPHPTHADAGTGLVPRHPGQRGGGGQRGHRATLGAPALAPRRAAGPAPPDHPADAAGVAPRLPVRGAGCAAASAARLTTLLFFPFLANGTPPCPTPACAPWAGACVPPPPWPRQRPRCGGAPTGPSGSISSCRTRPRPMRPRWKRPWPVWRRCMRSSASRPPCPRAGARTLRPSWTPWSKRARPWRVFPSAS